MGNRVIILFFMISALSFLFVVFSALFLRKRAADKKICSGFLWFLMFAAVIFPLCDVYSLIDLKLFINFTGGLRIEAANVLTDTIFISDLFIPKNILDAATSICTVLVTIRIVSSAAYFTYSFAGYLNNLHFLTKNSEECHDDKIKIIFETAKKKAGLKRNISLRVMNRQIRLSPCTCGINFPAVYIGKEILYDYTEERLELVFLHELTHIRNHDASLKLFTLFAASLFIGLPFSKKISEAVYEDAEYRCDAAVISKTGTDTIGEYMAMIMDVTERNMKNDYRGYDFLSPVSRSGEMILNRYRFMKENKQSKKFSFSMASVILLAVVCNIFLMSSVSIVNIDNLGVDLANPLLEKAVCSYFDIDDPHEITAQHIDSVYSIEFRLSDYQEALDNNDGYYAVAVEINEGLIKKDDLYSKPLPFDNDYIIICDVIEPIILPNRFELLSITDPCWNDLLKDSYNDADAVMYLKTDDTHIKEYLEKGSLDGFFSAHMTAGRNADTRDIAIFNGLRTLILSDRIRSINEDIYISEKYAVVERDK